MSPRLKSVMNKLNYAGLPTFEGVALTDANIKGLSFGDTPLHIMAMWGDTEAIQILLEEGAELEARGEDGFTPLHCAVEQDKIDAVRLLLDVGANPCLRTSDGTDAFALAEVLGHTAVLNLLNEKKN